MPGVTAEEENVQDGRISNGNGRMENQDGMHRKSKSDDSASFLRAARGGNSEKVLEYLKNSLDINTCNANGLNALHLASKEGHVNIVNELLARGAKIDSATKKGNTALHIASLAGQEEIVKILVNHSASVNVQSQNGFTPLYMAAQENHDGVVRFLLASGASQSLATEDGFTPLAVALQQGHDKVVAVLLENDTRGKVRLPALHIAAKKDDTKAAALLLQNDHNPDVTSKSGFTPLHIAAHYGNENIATLLLQRGADVNYSAKHNITPLHVAAKWGKGNMVGLLLDKGSNLEAKTRDGLTPLHCAARSGHENVVDMMLQRGAPISAKTKNGLAPLHMASQGDHVDAARILLHHKAPVDEVTVDYLTALHVAAHCGHVRVAKLLLDRKGDPNARALNGFTPLHIACKKNRIKVVELLLKYGASIEATTESGLTPLHVASFMGCMNIVIYLIQHQASPDEATVRGETPLHLAARANQTDIIRILLRNGAKVDARAREQQTPLHIASRLGNVDIVVLLLQSGAQVDATTKDLYTALHIAAKEGQEEVGSILLENGASMEATTKKGFTPLHLAAKYGNIKVAKLLLQKNAPVDAEGKNGVTPLHVAAHYDNQNVALLLLDKGASPHASAKNGYTPLHIAAKKNQMEIGRTLLEYHAKVDAESKAGFTPLHLAAQEGHIDMNHLLIKHKADINAKAKNGLTPIHLCAQEDRVAVASVLVENGGDCGGSTRAGYTPLHVACHFGQLGMVRFLLEQGVAVDVQNELGYSPLHQAAQQGHSQIVNLLLDAGASPNSVSNNGQTALSIAQKLAYVSVVETLKEVTDTVVTTTTTTTVEEKYKVLAPESNQETFFSDSDDEGGDENIHDHSYKYLTTEEMKSLGDDSMPMDTDRDDGPGKKDSRQEAKEKKISVEQEMMHKMAMPSESIEKKLVEMEQQRDYKTPLNADIYEPDNIELPPVTPVPVTAGVRGAISHVSVATSIGNQSTTSSMWRERFLVSFMVDARGGAMRGCRHSGVRVIIPPRKAPMPMRVTCRYLKKDKLIHPPPLMEGEAIASRVLELGPASAKFLGPVIIEVPHFASLRGKEREIVILRSDNGETWREHTLEATEEAVQEVLQESFDGEDASQLEDLNTSRITRILTTDFPQYFAVISRIRQEVHAIGPDGGVVNSTVVPQVQAVFPQGALTKKIKVGLQAQPIPPELTAKLLGNRVAVSPIVTVEPRRRKFHKAITLTIPVPQAAGKGMINQYSGETPTLRLLCSITGGTTRAQWEDVTGSTPLTFVNDCVNFTTTVSARFWLMDCRNVAEATKMATELYKEAIHVPFMAKFCVYAKRHDPMEARMRVFCMTDDKEDKTLEHQEHFMEVAKSRDVEVLEGKTHHIEFSGNLIPVTKSGDQLQHKFHAFRENRLPFTIKVKDPHSDPMGRIVFMREAKQDRKEAPQTPICTLNIALPENITPESHHTDADLMAIQAKYSFLREAGYGKFDTIHRADLRVSDISNLLGSDWIRLARELDIEDQDINLIMSEYPDNVCQQAMVMLRLWLNTEGNQATGNALEKALRKCDREDIVNKCIFNIEMVTDEMEKSFAQTHLDQSGFDAFKAELGPSTNSTLKRDYSMDVSYDEQDVNQIDDENERLAGIAEEVTTRSEISKQMNNKHEEATSVYEREEQKYIAEEKEVVTSIHEEATEKLFEQSESALISEKEQITNVNNQNIHTIECKEQFNQEKKHKDSHEETHAMRIEKDNEVVEKTSHSKLEEELSSKEQYASDVSEQKISEIKQTEDGAILTQTQTKKESAQSFSSHQQESSHFVQSQTVTGADPSQEEASKVVMSQAQESSIEGMEEAVLTTSEYIKTSVTPPQGTQSPKLHHGVSSSYSEDSEPESPRSPSPKVSPGSHAPDDDSSADECHNIHSSLPEYTPSKLPYQQSVPYEPSSGASSHASSQNNLDNFPETDLKEAEQELLDEMIVKDVPDSESSTDPVKLFEDSHPTIDSIQEDQEDNSTTEVECKDPSLSHLTLATSISLKHTLSQHSNESSPDYEPSHEMPIENDIRLQHAEEKNVDEYDMEESCLAAPDSKDSLEVQVYSVCEDLSEMAENLSGKDESYDGMKAKQESSDSEGERELILNDKSLPIDPEVTLETPAEINVNLEEGFEIISNCEQTSVLSPIEEKSVTISEAVDDVTTEEQKQDSTHSSNDDLKNVEATYEIVETIDFNQYKFSPGMLHIVIHKASELENSDYVGNSDPYATAEYNQQKFKSNTIGNTSQPEWNYSFDILVTEDDGHPILIEVFDDDYDQDDSIGCISFDIRELMKNQNNSNKWYDLTNCKTGRILVSTTFVPKSFEGIRNSEKLVKASSSSFEEPGVDSQKNYQKDSSDYDEVLVQKVVQKDSSDYEELSDHKLDLKVTQRDSSDYDELSDHKFEEKLTHAPKQQDTLDDDEHETSSEEEAEKNEKKIVEYDSSDYEVQDKSKKPTNYDSSDYSSISNLQSKGKRPDSFISDTSSDYEISDGKSKRPESFVLDDEYDVITEEDITSSRHEVVTERRMLATSSSSEFEGPDKKEIDQANAVDNFIAPPAIQIQSLRGDKEHDGENGISQPSPNDSLLPEDSLAPLQSSVASGSLLLSSDLHAEQSSVNVDVAESSVINSNTLEEIDPLAKDQEINTSTHVSNENLTTIKPSAEISLIDAHIPPQSTPRCSSSSSSSVAQVLRDGSSDTNKSQDTGMSMEQDGKFDPSKPSQESVLLPHTPPPSPITKSVDTESKPEFPSSPSAYRVDTDSKVTRKADFQDVLSKFEEISRSDVGTKRLSDRMSSTESNTSEKAMKGHFKLTTGSSTDASSCSVSHSTVRQTVTRQDTITDSSDYESSSHHGRRTSTSSSEVELLPAAATDKKKKSPVSILNISKIGTDSDECAQQPERSPLQKAQFDAFVKPAIDEIEDVCEQYEHKPIPKTKEDNNINSAELFTRQIKGEMFDTVLHEDEDSQMSESTIEYTLDIVEKKAGDYIESMQVIEQKFKESLHSVGKSQEDEKDIDYDTLRHYHAEIPKKKDSFEEPLASVMQAEVKTIEEPDWEIVEVQQVKERGEEEKSKKAIRPDNLKENAIEIMETIDFNQYKFSPGILHIVIHKASELDNSDYIGKSDPYVTVEYNQQKFKSNIIGNTVEPEWNYSFDILVTEDDGQPILVEVFDDDYDQDDSIGCVALDIGELMKNQKNSNKWYDLTNCETGKIQVSTTFVPKSIETIIESEKLSSNFEEENKESMHYDDISNYLVQKIDHKLSSNYDVIICQNGEEVKKKQAMTPEKALELATEIVQNVQIEAIKKYEELMSTQSLPKPTAGSKFTHETKEKVQEYLKEMEDSEAYDQVASELIQKVVTKKEEKLKRKNQLEISIDITEEEPRSDAMLNELRNELRRNSISITDEDLKCDFNSDLLEEHAGLARHLDEVRSSLGAATAGIKQFSQLEKDRSDTDFQFSAQILEQIDQQVPSDFRFQASFRSHFVQDNNIPESELTENKISLMHLETKSENSYSGSGGSVDLTKETPRKESTPFLFQSNGGTYENQPMNEDIWAEESKVVFRKDFKGFRDKKSDTESTSSGSRHNLKSLVDRKSGTDHDGSGWSSSTETPYLTAEEQTKTTTASSHSRPSSSDVDAMLSAVSEISSASGTNTYKTAQDISTAESSLYYTAGSSISSRESVQSSESSGNLASFEVSECSETLVESSLEFEPNRSDTPSSGGPLDEISFDGIHQRQHLPTFVQKDASVTTSTDDISPDKQSSMQRSKEIIDGSELRMKHKIPLTPEEIQLLEEDDVDGNCLKGQSKNTYDEEREYLISESKDTIASRFSESRETLSSSVLTLSSMSDATIVQRENKEWEPPSLSSEIGNSQLLDSEKKVESLTASLITQLTDSTSSTSTSGLATHGTPNTDIGELQSSTEEMKGPITNDEDQVFPLPRMRSFEGTQSVHFSFPQQMSLDFGSEYDSRPVSELGEHSRPQSKSERAMSGSSSNEGATNEDIPRSHSVEERLSDCLKVTEPFVRPVSPLPDSTRPHFVQPLSCFGDGLKPLDKVAGHVSPTLLQQRDLQSVESIEAEIAFSKHFTQVLDDPTDYDSNDAIKINEEHLTGKTDLTPESIGTSESVETSQGQEYLIDEDSLENKPSPLQPHFDIEDQDDLLVGSPPMVSRPLGVKYWPPLDNLDQELDGGGPVDKRSITRSESDDNSESRLDLDNDLIEKEVEEGKRWLENQFDGPVAPQEDPNFYGYGQPLDQILEEEEDRESHSSIDNQELMRLKESLSSTPDFDVIINKRHLVSKSAENDDISLGSLTEFERLEREVALGSGTGSRGSIGSNDSLETYGNGNGKASNLITKSTLRPESGDNVSVLSFEMMEKACVDADNIEKRAKEQEEVLSEIEEGHESQVSESESGETLSECEPKSDDEYEDRMFKIDEIIRQAQSNVEKFETDKPVTNEISLADIMGQPESRTESVGHCSGDNDSLDGETVPELPKEKELPRQSSMPNKLPSTTASRTTSVTSLHSMASITSVSTLTQFDADSIRDRDLEVDDIMQASADSLEFKIKSPDNTMITSTDSLEATRTIDKMTFSTDSIENGTSTSRNNDVMTVSVDSLEGSKNGMLEKSISVSRGLHDDVDGATAMLQTSTDSFESSSTNTRATASMLSSMTSITSQGSETLVADDEFEFDNDDSFNARRYLLNQGNIPIEDSDDSVSHSSPITQATTYSQDFSQEEILETHEIDSSGNRVVKKIIQKRIDIENQPNTVKFSDRKVESYFRDLSEKRDDSCEETIEEIDEFGNRRKYVVKRSIESATAFETLDVVHDRRQQRGLSPIGDIFRSIAEDQPQSILEKRQPIHHTETMTKVFDAPPSTPSPPSSPLSSSFRVSPPTLKKY